MFISTTDPSVECVGNVQWYSISVHESIYLKCYVHVCVCVLFIWVLYTDDNSVQVVYSSKVYLYMNLYMKVEFPCLCLCPFI